MLVLPVIIISGDNYVDANTLNEELSIVRKIIRKIPTFEKENLQSKRRKIRICFQNLT